MKGKRIRGYVVVAAVLLPYATSLAQSVDVKQLASLKQTLPLAELDDSFVALKASSSNVYDMGTYYAMLSVMYGDRANEGSDFVKFVDLLWTKGDTVAFAGEPYLVAYRLDFSDLGGPVRLDRGAPRAERLRLHLVRLATLATLTPYADVTPAQFRALFQPEEGPQEQSGTQEKALSNAKQIGLGLLMYCADYDDVTPYAQSTATAQWVTLPYLKSLDLWDTGNPNGSRFLLNMAIAGASLLDVERPADTVMYYESAPWPDRRRVVVFTDGHAKVLTQEEWETASQTLRLKVKKSAKPLPADYGLKELRQMANRGY
jgi:hypothetical protein